MHPHVRAAYDAFARYGFIALQEQPVSCSAGDGIAARLTAGLASQPLASVSVEALAEYLPLAMTHLGSVTDFKHFLPRLLELLFPRADHPQLVPELLVIALEVAAFHAWPASEQLAVSNACRFAPPGSPLAVVAAELDDLRLPPDPAA